jgi:3-isopropylmalate/(R)-2-methylmalate dehydratase small subunit
MADIEWLQRAVAREPERELVLDLEHGEARFGDRSVPVRVPEGARRELTTGTWNATGVLLEAGDAIERVAHGIPYIRGF